MIKHFIKLEWKQFTRSSYFQRNLIVKILLIFLAFYFFLSFLTLGVGTYFLLEEQFPNKDPLVLVSNYLVYWFLLDLVYRFFLQNLPILNVKPYMGLPIKKHKLLHYLLGKSTFSFYNVLPLFFFLPFAVVLLFQGYPTLNVINWFFAMVFLELCINFINFIINENNTIFVLLLSVLLVLAGLHYYAVFDVPATAGYVFYRLYEVPYAFVIPLLLMVLLYRRIYDVIKQGFYLDDKVSSKTKKVRSYELNWLNRFGDVALFLKNDLRLIMRNVRPKNVLATAFLFLFYGLLFFTQDIYKDKTIVMVFASVFITGGFLLTFGQLVPSWDSEYYKLLMSQNIPYRKYLESKWYLMVFATVISFVLSIPYIYFGWDIFSIILAGALFNIGLNSFITLYGGALNRSRVELNSKAKPFSNKQKFNPTQMLIALPKMVLPISLFYIPYLIFGFKAGFITLGACGILGLLFKNFFLNKIEKVYQNGKYKTVAAFEETN